MSTKNRSDARVMFEAAEENNGCAQEVKRWAHGVVLRQRLHRYRAYLREESAKVHQPGDPLYGKTEYDKMVVQLSPHPVKNPEGDKEKPWVIKIVPDETFVKGLHLLDPNTLEPLK